MGRRRGYINLVGTLENLRIRETSVITDIECLRFSYESNLFRAIEARLGSVPFIGQSQAQNLLTARKRHLLGDAVHITSDLLPDVHDVYQSCLDMFDNNLHGNLFVHQSKEYNASVFAHGRRFDLLIHSALLKDFTLEELRFVLGHELGHVLFGHSRFPVREILSSIEEINPDSVSPETRHLLFRWSRAAELSADRIGLLCCGQLTTAVKALFQTSSGLSGIEVDRVLRSFHDQYEALEAHIEKISDSKGWMHTHPMIPIRFKALELAALDIVALRQQSNAFSLKGFRAIDQKIAFILKTLDNSLAPTQML